jgi:hypothetical protein
VTVVGVGGIDQLADNLEEEDAFVIDWLEFVTELQELGSQLVSILYFDQRFGLGHDEIPTTV